MKQKKILFIILIILSFTACRKNDNQKQESFTYQILGDILGIDGDSISLVIPSQGGIEKRLKSVIKNGKFSFSGVSKKPSTASIRFEHDIKTNSPNHSLIPVLLEPGNITISATLKEDLDFYRDFSDIKIVSGENNKLFYQLIYDDFIGSHFTNINNYNNKRDSIQFNVYKEQKTLFFKNFDSIFNSKNTIVYANILNFIINPYSPPFDKDYINKNDRENLTKLLHKIDSNLIDYKTYQDLKFNIKNVTKIKTKVLFKNFSLPNKSQEYINLKDIIKNNDFTVLDFWWSGCGPCRIFNKESKKTYSKLKEHKIEIIGINTDSDAIKWKKASLKDEIDWIDLYSGNKSDIQITYNVKAFPTKVIIDKNYNIIDFEFKKAEELFKLVNNNNK